MGSWQGYATAVIARALQDNDNGGMLFAIDDFSLGTSAAQLHNNLMALQLDNVIILDGDSKKVEWPTPVNFAFIDGDHSIEGAMHDTMRAFERGANCIVLHDTQSWWGPRDLVELFRSKDSDNTDIMEVNFDQGLAVLMKKPQMIPVQYSKKDYPTGKVN